MSRRAGAACPERVPGGVAPAVWNMGLSKTRRYLVLLRGVNNIGMTRRVAMADLRALFERLGFRDVGTLLNSGNVVFSARAAGRAEVRARLERGLARRLGIQSSVTVLTGREVARAVRDNPLCRVATNPSHLLIVVPQRRADLKRLRRLAGAQASGEVLALGDRVAYLWCARGVARSRLWSAVDRALERTGTVRNFATFTKAAGLVSAPASRLDRKLMLSRRRGRVQNPPKRGAR